MDLLKKIKKNLIITGESAKYEKVGYNYSEAMFNNIKRELKAYIDSMETTISTYNKRKEVEKDKNGNNLVDENGNLIRPNKQKIYPLLEKNAVLYKKAKNDITHYLTSYSANKKLKEKTTKLEKILNCLIEVQYKISYHDRLPGKKQTTANSFVKIKNSFRWKKQREPALKELNELISLYKKL